MPPSATGTWVAPSPSEDESRTDDASNTPTLPSSLEEEELGLPFAPRDRTLLGGTGLRWGW